MKMWHLLITTFLFFLVLVSCSDAPEAVPEKGTISTVTDTADVKFSIRPAQPQPETPFEIELTLPSDWEPQPSELVAITMYMGSLPVRWDAQGENAWIATVQVGACAESIMEWQVRVPLLTPQGNELLFFPVVTYVNP